MYMIFTYFSARTHIFWHSSSVILLKMSTSNGPPSRLFSSLMNTVNPSQRRSASCKINIIIILCMSAASSNRFGSRGETNSSYHSSKCFPSSQSLDHLREVRDVFVVCTVSLSSYANLNRNWLNGTQMSIHSNIYLHNPIDWPRLSVQMESKQNEIDRSFNSSKKNAIGTNELAGHYLFDICLG